MSTETSLAVFQEHSVPAALQERVLELVPDFGDMSAEDQREMVVYFL